MISKKAEGPLRAIYHGLGISAVLAAFITELWMFSDIATHGYFLAVESNLAILSIEVLLALFGLIYFLMRLRKMLKR